jgi:hypothetical protein
MRGLGADPRLEVAHRIPCLEHGNQVFTLLGAGPQTESQRCLPNHLISAVASERQETIIDIKDLSIFLRADDDRKRVVLHELGAYGIVGLQQIHHDPP